MPPRTKIETMPPSVRKLIRDAIHRAGYAQYAAVALGLRKRGIDVSESCVRRYGAQLRTKVMLLEAQAMRQAGDGCSVGGLGLPEGGGSIVFVIDTKSRQTTIIETGASPDQVFSTLNSIQFQKEGNS
jgi:hypothetical protein